MLDERIFESLIVVTLFFNLLKLHGKRSWIKEMQTKIQLYMGRSKIRPTDQQSQEAAEPQCRTCPQGGFCVGLEIQLRMGAAIGKLSRNLSHKNDLIVQNTWKITILAPTRTTPNWVTLPIQSVMIDFSTGALHSNK